jgi:choline kinase
MVAGMSSRFGGKIKQFARVGPQGETLIEVSIKQAINAGYNKIVFIVGEMTEKPFKEMFGNNYQGIPIFYAKQIFDPKLRDKPGGTCDAVVCAKEVINEDFVVCNGDDLYGENTFRSLIKFSKENKIDCATIGYKLGNALPEQGTVNRGIFSKDEFDYLVGIKETLNISKQNLKELNLNENNLSSQNIFFIKKETLTLLEEKLIKFKKTHNDDRKSECYLPTELSNLINENKIKIKLIPTIDKWFGVTNPEDEEVVREQLKQNNATKETL